MTISYEKFLHFTGKLDQIPAGTPYYPLLTTPIETISSDPKYQSLRWSIVELAAENTELPPLAFNTSPPRF